MNSLKAVAAPNNAGPLLDTKEIDPNTTDPTELEALIKKNENELGPLKKLYEDSDKKYGNFWLTPTPEWIAEHEAQERRKKRIEALEKEISEYRSRLQ